MERFKCGGILAFLEEAMYLLSIKVLQGKSIKVLVFRLEVDTGFQILRDGRRKYFKKTLTELQLLGL